MQEVIFLLCHRIAIDYYVLRIRSRQWRQLTDLDSQQLFETIKSRAIYVLLRGGTHVSFNCRCVNPFVRSIRIEGNLIYCDVPFAWATANATSRRDAHRPSDPAYRNSRRTIFSKFCLLLFILSGIMSGALGALGHSVSHFRRPTVLDIYCICLAVCTPYFSRCLND